MATDPAEISRDAHGEHPQTSPPLAGTRSQSMQRLQIGLFGLAAMILLVSLANIILNSAEENEARVVPGAAPTVASTTPATPVSDPLADAGVVPDRAGPGDSSATQAPAVDAPALQP